MKLQTYRSQLGVVLQETFLFAGTILENVAFARPDATPEQILAGTKAIVELIRTRHPTTKILILRIFPRGGDGEQGFAERVFHSSPTCVETCRRAGALTEQLADGKQVFWLDVGGVFLRPDGTIDTDVMPDLLHPNLKGAEAWASAIEPTLAKLLGETPAP